jgi:hypothetical protein
LREAAIRAPEPQLFPPMPSAAATCDTRSQLRPKHGGNRDAASIARRIRSEGPGGPA